MRLKVERLTDGPGPQEAIIRVLTADGESEEVVVHRPSIVDDWIDVGLSPSSGGRPNLRGIRRRRRCPGAGEFGFRPQLLSSDPEHDFDGPRDSHRNRARGLIGFEPAPVPGAFSSTSVDLTLAESARVYRDEAARGIAIDPGRPTFSFAKTSEIVTRPVTIAGSGWRLAPSQLFLAWTREADRTPRTIAACGQGRGKEFPGATRRRHSYHSADDPRRFQRPRFSSKLSTMAASTSFCGPACASAS